MSKGIIEKIEEVVAKGKAGVVNISLTTEDKAIFDKLEEEGRLKKEVISIWKMYFLEIRDTFVKINIVNIKDFTNKLFDKVEDFIKAEEEDAVFNFPEDVEDVLSRHKEVTPYISTLTDEYMRRFDKVKYRGFVTEATKKDNGFILTKEFVANYKVLFFSKSNKPYTRIKKLSEEVSLYIPNYRDYVIEDKNTVVCLYKNLDRILDVNKIESKDVVIDKNSIEQFYVFNDNYFVNPTKKWVNMWWNCDCPNLYRYMPNISGTSNFFGLCLICWQNLLIESSWNYTHIEEDITEKEVEAFGEDYKHTAIYSQMQRVLKARNMTEEEKQEKIKEAEKIEKEIQDIINEHKEEIMFSTLNDFKSYCELDMEEVKTLDEEEIQNLFHKIDSQMGLDCGFLYFKLAKGDELFKEISEYDSNHFKDGSLNINLPIFVQSTTIKRKMAEHIKNVVEDNSNYELTYWTTLD